MKTNEATIEELYQIARESRMHSASVSELLKSVVVETPTIRAPRKRCSPDPIRQDLTFEEKLRTPYGL